MAKKQTKSVKNTAAVGKATKAKASTKSTAVARPATKVRRRVYKEDDSIDGVFVLKMAVLVIIGSIWLKLMGNAAGAHIPLPVGLIAGLLLTTHKTFRGDRKIAYAVLVCATLFGYVAPYGIFIHM